MSARVEPPALARARLYRPVVDYVFDLRPFAAIATASSAWGSLRPLPGERLRSWNHTTMVRGHPIAINIEVKGPMKSWTDGKPQLAIWTDAWLERLKMLWQDGRRGVPGDRPAFRPPSVPVLIAQGHDWHLLIVTKDEEKTILREKIDIGSTRTCFDAMKLVAVLHWLMDWAHTVWRPWFVSLIGGGEN